MAGKDIKQLWTRTQATARIAFNPKSGELATTYWTYIFDGLLGNSWRNKSMADAILLIEDDREVSGQVKIFAARIETLRREQSLFVSA